MGYDMTLVDCDDDELDGMDDPSYFRRNIWGMGTTRDLMETFGMGYWPDGEKPFPIVCQGLDDDAYDAVCEAVDARMAGAESTDTIDDPTLVAAIDAKCAWLTEHGEATGISMHKLASNDGWLVTREECDGAVKAYEAVKPELKTQAFAACVNDNSDTDAAGYQAWFEEWVNYLRRGATGKGFRVY